MHLHIYLDLLCTLCGLQHALDECGLAEEEVVGLRESLVALHRQLKQSPPAYKARLSFSTATPSRAKARRFPLTASLSYTPTPSKPKLMLATPTKPRLSPVVETSLHESPHSQVEKKYFVSILFFSLFFCF